jgi:hypothetical protein
MRLFPESNAAVVLMSNSEYANLWPMARAIEGLLLND